MQAARDSLFMGLPTELRRRIYSYLPDIAYDPVFPQPGICSWEAYRMPTALLQLNKTIYEEVKHHSIQKPLQMVNNQLLPTIILGPTRTDITPVYVALSDFFYQAGKQLHTFLGGSQEHSDEVENISLDLASWYNNTYLPQQVPSGHGEAFETQTECRPKRLYRFVKQTLKRMAVKKTCEIRVRLLVHPLGLLPGRESRSVDLSFDYKFYEIMAALDTRRQGLSSGMGRELKIVYASRRCKGFMAPLYDDYRRRGLNIKIAQAHERDWGLFDMARSLR